MKGGELKTLAKIVKIARRAQKQGKKIVTTNGCFDLLHIGHVRSLKFAKSLGDILIVGVNSDLSVRANKGPLRPIIPEKERAEILAALEAVDYVFIFSDKTPVGWLKKIRPDIHVKGADRSLRQIVERAVLKKIGAKLVFAPIVKGKSTTELIKKLSEKR